MDDRVDDGGADLDAFAAAANTGTGRWHSAPGGTATDRTLVLDDGTGDIELRFSAAGGDLRVALFYRDAETASFIRPTSLGPGGQSAAFRAWLAESLGRHVHSASVKAGPAKGKARFIASFGAAQLAGLRERAERDGVSIAEIVRRAVDAYLTADGPE